MGSTAALACVLAAVLVAGESARGCLPASDGCRQAKRSHLKLHKAVKPPLRIPCRRQRQLLPRGHVRVPDQARPNVLRLEMPGVNRSLPPNCPASRVQTPRPRHSDHAPPQPYLNRDEVQAACAGLHTLDACGAAAGAACVWLPGISECAARDVCSDLDQRSCAAVMLPQEVQVRIRTDMSG